MFLIVAIVIVSAAICARLGYQLGGERGRPGTGAVLGLMFGVVGLFLIAVLDMTPEATVERERKIARLRDRVPTRPAEGESPTAESGERWLPDPLERHEQRLWNGERWSRFVRDGDRSSQDDGPNLDRLPPPARVI